MHPNPSLSQRLVADRQAAFRRQAGLARLNRATKRAQREHHVHRPPPKR